MLMDFDVLDLVWDKWNTPHVRKHGSSREEVDLVCFGRPVRYKESYKNRTILIGPGFGGRLMTVIVGPVPDAAVGYYYTFSARPASRKERAYYAETRRTQSPETEH